MSRVGLEQFSLRFFIHVSHMTEILVIILFIACSVTELKQGAMSAREENMVLLVFSLVLAKLSSLIYFQKSLLCVCSKKRLFFSLQHIGGRQNVSEIPQCHLYYLEKSLSCKIDSLSQNSVCLSIEVWLFNHTWKQQLTCALGISCTVVPMLL